MAMKFSLLTESFKNKRVFITGHTGFKGTWLTKILHSCGAQIMGFSNDPVGINSHFSKVIKSSDIQSINGDIRDKIKFQNNLLNFDPEYVFHLAAQPSLHFPSQHC